MFETADHQDQGDQPWRRCRRDERGPGGIGEALRLSHPGLRGKAVGQGCGKAPASGDRPDREASEATAGKTEDQAKAAPAEKLGQS